LDLVVPEAADLTMTMTILAAAVSAVAVVVDEAVVLAAAVAAAAVAGVFQVEAEDPPVAVAPLAVGNAFQH
jgi:hypothetical protein